jgi:hypothetical protein
MKTMTRPSTDGGAAGTKWVLSWLLLVSLCMSTWAAGGGGGSGGGGSTPPSPTVLGPEEGGSLPIVNDVFGLTFVGLPRELRALAISINGRGQVNIQRMGSGVIAVTLVGSYRVDLDRAALARSNVSILFRGGMTFANGTATLQIGSSAPVTLDPDRIPLPMARMAASPRAQGTLLTLDVFGRTRSEHISATFATDRVTMTQRLQ